MKKLVISLTSRQDSLFRDMARNLDIPVSELIRRALDKYIDDKVDDGTLTRFQYKDRAILEMPSDDFKKMYDYVKNNPGALQVEE